MGTKKAALRDLTHEQAERLLRFVSGEGEEWKAELNRLWWTGRDASLPDGHLLRQIRNQRGPVWLTNYTPFRVTSDKGIWYVSDGTGRRVPFHDGIVLPDALMRGGNS